LLNPVVAAMLGWAALSQRLNAWQLFGAVIVLVAVLLGQSHRAPALHRPEAQR
jgi:probable blue pigment (indigoidine) exporter